MTETIGIAISAGALILGIITFIVNRYDKKIAKREELFMKLDKELENTKIEVGSIKEVVRYHTGKIENIEMNANKLENSIDKQMSNFNDKLEKIYSFLLEQNKK